ncbi:MAG TPA: NADH-quinone oxidoreductase subunit N [bacterium]|nr:NADH-quinone oxidoreductase subunit N [bacterium]HPP02420.1 NADH-quinone oxidoreductase subunit N [bacterium]
MTTPPPPFPDLALMAVSPQAVLLITALVILCLDLLGKKIEKINITLTALTGVVAAYACTQGLSASDEAVFAGMVWRDGWSIYLDQLFLAGTALIVLLSHWYAERQQMDAYGEFTVLMLFATLGMMVVSISADLVTVFIGIELLSICLYVLTGFNKSSLASGEAAVKYFLLGAFSTGFFVYGLAFLFGVCHTTNLGAIGQAAAMEEGTPLLVLGFALVLAGLGFKISLVPFHMWAPDVYQGAPTPVTAWIAAGSKIAGFAALARIFSLPDLSFAPLGELWAEGIWLLSLATMIVGNAGALVQNDIKRLLAYSSVAHGGYLAMAFTARNTVGLEALFFYLAAYLFMTIGAFGIVMLARRNGEECCSLADFSGLAHQHPMLGALMAVFLFSLAGMPFTAGFVGKLWLFGAAIQAEYYVLAVTGILTTLLSFYYYLRVIVYMYMREPESGTVFDPPAASGVIATGMAALGIVVLGVFPNLVWKVLAAQMRGI